MVEGRYSLRRKLNPTPKSKISERVLSNREKRTPTVSPALSSVLPLPPQPDFASSTRSDPPASPEQPGDAELESAAAQVDYWLGPGASDDIASMCIDAELSPEEDFVGSSMDEAPLSAISALGLAFNPDGNATPECNTCPPTPDMNVFSPAPVMDEPSMEEGSHTSNPFPPLNPYPEYIFPTAPLIDQPLTAHEPLFNGTVADPVRSGVEEPNYDIPADDEDPLFFPDSDFSALGDDSTKENSPHQGAGRISQVKWEILNTGFQKIDNLIDNIATETRRTRENVITLWKRSHAHECSRSVWNKYQRYFLENRRLERQRIGDPSASCKACWEGFKRLKPKWREILDAHDEMLTASETRSTISARTRKFDTLVSKLQSLASNASDKDGFESLIVLCGNSIHEDSGLSHVYVSAGAEKFVDQRLRFDKDTLSGLFRNHVCNRVSEGLETRLEMDIKPPTGMAATSGPKTAQKRDHDEESVVSLDDEGGSKSSGLSGTDAKAIIKAGFKKVLEPFSLDLSFEEIPWAKLAGVLAPAGLMIDNWPRTVNFPRAQPKREVPPGATVVRRRHTSQGIKDLGNRGIRALAESFASDVTRIRVVRVSAELLLTSKIPLFVDGPPGPGSRSVIRRAFANGRTDQITVNDHGAILPPVPEVIEITSSSPPSADPIHPSHRSRHQSKKAKTPDSDNFPLHRARKRTAKKSKAVVSDSEEISDVEDNLKPKASKKAKVVEKAMTRGAKGKERAMELKKPLINVDVMEEDVTSSAALPATKSRKLSSPPMMTAANTSNAPPSTKLVPIPFTEMAAAIANKSKPVSNEFVVDAASSAAPPATTSQKPSPPIMTAANTSNAPPFKKLVPRPLSEWAAAAQALAIANNFKPVSNESVAALQSTTAQPISTTKPKPRPIKKPTAVIWDSGDPFLVKPSASIGEEHLQGPGQAPKPRTQLAPPTTTSTQKQPKPSAFGPPRLPSTAPTPSISKPPSKRTADSQKLVQTTSNKKPRTVNESGWDMMHDTLPEGDPVAEAMEEEQAAGLPEELASGEPTEEDVAAESAAQGYQWPYGAYYPPFGYPPPPGWGYQPWNQDRPAGSAVSGPDFPPFPPPHPGLPYPPPPHGYYPPGAAAARPAYARPPAKPANAEPGPSRLA